MGELQVEAWPDDDPGKAEGNAALWVKKDGTLAVIFVTIFGRDWWDDSKIRMIESTDDGDTWSDPTLVVRPPSRPSWTISTTWFKSPESTTWGWHPIL